jgi:nitrogen fixation protein NifQ
MGGRPLIYQPLPGIVARRSTRDDEVADLMALLLDHADPSAGPPADAALVAETLAVACLGDNHLWQDLQLPSRTELSALIAHWFPALKARNSGDMKWKKFLYKQLCEREQINVCKAPSCAVCTDHTLCFGPES